MKSLNILKYSYLLFTFSFSLSALAAPPAPGLSQALDLLDIHTRGNLANRWDEVLDFGQHANLTKRREDFLKLIDHENQNYITQTFGYSQYRELHNTNYKPDPYLTVYSQTPVRIGEGRHWFQFPKKIANDRAFIYSENGTSFLSQLILPLRVEKDVVLFAVSHGTSAPGFGFSGGTTLAIAFRLEKFDKPKDLDQKNLWQLFLSWGNAKTDKLNSLLEKELERYPDIYNLPQRFQTEHLNINFDRLNMNLVFRDMRTEMESMVRTAAALHGVTWVDQALELGSTGFFQTPDGKDQYFIQTIKFKGDLLDYEKKLILAMSDPNFEHNTIYRQISDAKGVKEVIEKVKKKRAKMDCDQALGDIIKKSK